MRKLRKAIISTICIAEAFFVMGSVTACAVRNDSMVPQQESVITTETQQQTTAQPNAPQQTETQPAEAQPQIQTQQPDTSRLPADSAINVADPNAAQQTTAQPNTNQPVPNGNGQISLDEAKTAALSDAGVSASEVMYTKEKLDYEDGIAVYEIEFYAGNTEYEYEINATTGAVYSKSVETHQTPKGQGQGHHGNTGIPQTDIGAESAKSIALNHAGFAEADVSRLKTEFDIDDGISVYEVEFDKDGREYEYKINAADGSIIEYDVD